MVVDALADEVFVAEEVRLEVGVRVGLGDTDGMSYSNIFTEYEPDPYMSTIIYVNLF